MKDVVKNLKPNENIIAVIKKYFIAVLKDIFISILFFIVSCVLFYFILKLENNEALKGVLFILFGILITASVILFIRTIYLWYHDSLIVTNQRIFDITQNGFFDRQVAEVTLSDIKSISYIKNGVFQTLLNFGDLKVEIQNDVAGLEIKNIKDPSDIQQLINDRKEKFVKTNSEKEKIENMSEEEAIGFAYKIKEKLSKEQINKIFND